MDQNLQSRGIDLRMKCQSGPDFQKTIVLRTRVCRTALIRSALESFDLGASNGVSNFIFRRFEANLIACRVAMNPQNLESREIRFINFVFEILGVHCHFTCNVIGPKASENKF